MPHAAAMAPNSLCLVRSGRPRPPPRIAAASSSAVPRYSCATIRGLPNVEVCYRVQVADGTGAGHLQALVL